MEHFADEFNAAVGGGRDVRTAPRAMAKLRRQVARTKHILSANTEASLSVEEMWLDRDFKATISREKFEALAGAGWCAAAGVVGWLQVGGAGARCRLRLPPRSRLPPLLSPTRRQLLGARCGAGDGAAEPQQLDRRRLDGH